MDRALTPPGLTVPPGQYEVTGQRYATDSREFAGAIADAHASHRRPRCLCQPGGIEMYIARLGEGYIVKRMPDTGSRHAPECPSYEPPADISGLAPLLGTAISEDPATGEISLKLDFALSKLPGRSGTPPSSAESGGSAASDGARLSLRGLLHYLWDQSELTRWQPGFAGKRSWATVRRHLLTAAQHKLAAGSDLRSRLYVPEPFSVEERDAINARRLALWPQAMPTPGKPQRLMLLIGEVKGIVPARRGYKAVIKHVPDQAFTVDEALYRRLGRRFEAELALWGASDDVHMVIIATFALGLCGLPAIAELSLMPTTRQWLPVEDAFDKQLVERLAAEERTFVLSLQYNLQRSACRTSATLIDCGSPAPTLTILRANDDDPSCVQQHRDTAANWVWRPESSAMPSLPALRQAQPASEDRQSCHPDRRLPSRHCGC